MNLVFETWATTMICISLRTHFCWLVFVEAFRKMSQTTYGLDPAHFMTAPNFAGSALLKITGETIHLLEDRTQLDVAEEMVRGGMASVYAKRHFHANNEKTGEPMNQLQPSTFGVLLDFNNLYGGVMSNGYFPTGDYEWVDITTDELLNTPDDNETGYRVEATIEYPDNLHDEHADFPLAPHTGCIQEKWLSEYQLHLLRENDLDHNSKAQKLLQTFFTKENYVMHYRVLKLYVQLGLKISKVHRVLAFTQKRWMKPYIDLNTRMRQNAQKKFEENFFKLMNNAVFGKGLESKRRRKVVKLVTSEAEAMKQCSMVQLVSVKPLAENLAAITKEALGNYRGNYVPYCSGRVLAPTFNFNFVTEQQCYRAIRRLDVNKPLGPSSIPAWAIKDGQHVLVKHICNIINAYISEGSFPISCKLLEICPLYKKEID